MAEWNSQLPFKKVDLQKDQNTVCIPAAMGGSFEWSFHSANLDLL